jgi:hypothetical protein
MAVVPVPDADIRVGVEQLRTLFQRDNAWRINRFCFDLKPVKKYCVARHSLQMRCV